MQAVFEFFQLYIAGFITIGGFIATLVLLLKLHSKWRDVEDLVKYKTDHQGDHKELDDTLKERHTQAELTRQNVDSLVNYKTDHQADHKLLDDTQKEGHTQAESTRHSVEDLVKYKDEHQDDHKQKDSTLSELKANSDIIMKYLIEPLLEKAVENSESPLKLTELGHTMAEEVGAASLIEKYIDRLEKEVRFEEKTSPYDLQEACFRLADTTVDGNFIDIFSEIESNVIKEVAFQRGIELGIVLRVVAHVLRDKLFDKHPTWTLSKIDENGIKG